MYKRCEAETTYMSSQKANWQIMRRVVKCWWWLNGCGMDEIHPMFIKDHQGWQLITKAKTKSTSPFCNDDKHNNRFSAKANIATTNRWMMADLRHWRIPFSSSGTAFVNYSHHPLMRKRPRFVQTSNEDTLALFIHIRILLSKWKEPSPFR